MDAEKALVLNESPAVIEPICFHDPHIPFTQFKSLVRLEQILFHCDLIPRFEGGTDEVAITGEKSVLANLRDDI